MDKSAELQALLDKLLVSIQSPIAHAYGYAELAQHELNNPDSDMARVDGDVNRIKVNLSRVLVYLQDFQEEYEQLR